MTRHSSSGWQSTEVTVIRGKSEELWSSPASCSLELALDSDFEEGGEDEREEEIDFASIKGISRFVERCFW